MILLEVEAAFENLRLDKFLCKQFDISFGIAQKTIRAKKVKVNGARVDGAYKIEEGDQIEIFADLKTRIHREKQKPKISDEKRKKFASWIVFEDENLMAINKPSGLAVQGGSGIELSVDDFLFGQELQLVHRLDKDTSGLLLIAKNAKAADIMINHFRNKTIHKTYFALVEGSPKKEDKIINIPLLKKLVGKQEKVRPDHLDGKEAITHFKLVESYMDFALVELNPVTGRTHQLRVHCKEIGHPVINDVKYGGRAVIRKDVCKRMCLHAYRIVIDDYYGKKLEIQTELPEFMN